MGDAEFEGGGSVRWQVNHSDGDFCAGHKHGGKGRDKNPRGPNGLFVVTVTGQKPIIVPAKGTTVRVVWGDLAGEATTTPAKSKAAKRKSTRSKAT